MWFCLEKWPWNEMWQKETELANYINVVMLNGKKIFFKKRPPGPPSKKKPPMEEKGAKYSVDIMNELSISDGSVIAISAWAIGVMRTWVLISYQPLTFWLRGKKRHEPANRFRRPVQLGGFFVFPASWRGAILAAGSFRFRLWSNSQFKWPGLVVVTLGQRWL